MVGYSEVEVQSGNLNRLQDRLTQISRAPSVSHSNSFADLSPRSRNHPTSSRAPLRAAASRGVNPSYPTQFRSAAPSRRYSAAAVCPPWQADQHAFVISSEVGSDSLAKNFSMCVINPSAAVCHNVGRAPRSTRRRAASHCPKATASASGVPSPITPPQASISAPWSRRASTTRTSLQLAAQWRGSPNDCQ